MNDNHQPEMIVRHAGNYIINTLYDNQRAVLLFSCFFGLGVVLLSFWLDVEDMVFETILAGDSQTVAGLLSILYASIAIIMAISSTTQRVSSENNRWLTGMLKVVGQFRLPIITSMLLVFLLFFSNSTIRIVELSEYAIVYESMLTFMIVTITVHVIFSTLNLSLNMLSYIKAEIRFSDDANGYSIIDSEEAFHKALDSTVERLRDSVSEVISALDRVTSEIGDTYLKRIPDEHPLIKSLSVMTRKLNRENLDPIRIYLDTLSSNSRYTDGESRALMKLHTSMSELDALTDEFESHRIELSERGTDLINCSTVIAIECRLNQYRDDKGNNENKGSNEIEYLIKSFVGTMTSMSSCMMKIDRCLEGMVGGNR